MHKNIKELSDYPAIKKLAAALHQFNANQHGAAIMIGAGFSRSAARHVSGEKKMPLWYEFSEKLAAELNPNDENLRFSDPLRLAEEYRAYFGQAALNDRIRSEIDDGAWQAGELYQSLLQLPWSEVMTTNWDTLLERAAKDIHGPYYTPVIRSSDLTWAQSPRIVKLHGTIGTTDTFIAAQEDYRTYPEKFAPFVNFARQVFIEKELCLLGFSGDDPNFLHWAGWVRDHLADHARKIYLVGALDLTAARRKHLESINIAPIDLWDAVKCFDGRDLQHEMATKFFLEAMINEGKSKVRPHEWSPSNLHHLQVTEEDLNRRIKDHEYAATLLKEQLGTLQKDRESYPDWLVCPPALQWQLKSQLNSPYPNPKNIAALDPDDRAKLLYEIAWRYSVAFAHIPSWLIELLFEVANPDSPCSLSSRQQLEIALVLLKNSRWLDADDEAGKKETQDHMNALITILEKHAHYLPDCVAELAYHQALIARDTMSYPGLEELIEKVTGEDPVWKLRKAALLADLGRFNEGEQLITDAYRELRERYRYDQGSIRILSRLTWAHWLLKAATGYQTNEIIKPLPGTFKDWLCDPLDWFEDIRSKVSKQQQKYIKNQNPIKPSFVQGHYRDNSKQLTFSNERPTIFLLDELSRNVGIPLRSGSSFMKVDLLASTVEELVLAGGVGVELWDYSLAIRAASSESSPSIEGTFSRIGLAKASQAVVDTLIAKILPVIDYWRKKRGNGTIDQQSHALSALRVLMEVLARLVVRVSPEKAQEIFQLAVSIGQQENLQHYWLSEALDDLLTHSLASIPQSMQGALLPEALMFPLESEVIDHRWPNPVINYPQERSFYTKLDSRINELIEIVTPIGSASSTCALLRLLPLVEKENFLTEPEQAKLANALWGNPADYKTLPNVNLFPHALLLLPSPDESQARAMVRKHLYEHGEDVLMDTQKELHTFPSPEIQRAISIYTGMANAAANEKTQLLPTPKQALALFNRLVIWRPPLEKDDIFGAANSDRGRLIESISYALSYAIVPALSDEAKTVDRFNLLQDFYQAIKGSAVVLPAFVYFSHINEPITSSVEKIIRKSLQGRNANEVSYAAIALQKWIGLVGASNSAHINSLISRLIAIIESGRAVGLHQLLWIAGELFKKKLLSDEQITTLKEALPNTFDAAGYANIEPSSREAISASSIREACIKLTNILTADDPEDSALHDLLEKAKVDTLPEVRFAVDVKQAGI